ncbi:hypothetical protein ACMGDK_11665 [Chryseobacterium sp. DT-3]|uniref:hypothetical protein n=1 Tax=Chryseobacterium sp. DT-3 TaxID=3396164 RepID=UPI003F1CF6A3
MTKEQYLEIYDMTIPFTDGMLNFYKKNKVELTQSGSIIAIGKVTDIRFCKDGDLRITNLKTGEDSLAFEMEINGEWHGPFNSHIKTPPSIYEDLDNWNNNHNK